MTTDLPVYELVREFSAPPATVWRTWSEPELLARWYGPNVETIIHELDMRKGGVWRNEMRMQKGSSYQLTEFLEVDAPNKFVCVMTPTDENWQPAGNPRMPDWPTHLLTTVTIEPTDAGSKLVLTWVPHEASAAEIACFAGAIAGLDQGWASGMELLEQLLSEL